MPSRRHRNSAFAEKSSNSILYQPYGKSVEQGKLNELQIWHGDPVVI